MLKIISRLEVFKLLMELPIGLDPQQILRVLKVLQDLKEIRVLKDLKVVLVLKELKVQPT
jgi:hypothetical protein